MVCERCILAVQQVLNNFDIKYIDIKLGEIILENELDNVSKEKLKANLFQLGFEIIDDRKSRIIEKIKNIIIDLVHYQSPLANQQKLSDILINQIHQDYHYLSKLFSEIEGITIEKYYILQKIEKVKELLVYDELTLSEIAYKLNYSSVAHLSNQFKKITGLTPSHFKQIGIDKRKPLDKI